MARKKMQEPERWITVNGQHLPVYPGGIIGQPGQEPPKEKKASKKSDEDKLVEKARKKLSGMSGIDQSKVAITPDSIKAAGGSVDIGDYHIEIGKLYNSKTGNYDGGFGKKTAVSTEKGGHRETKYFNSPEKAIEFAQKSSASKPATTSDEDFDSLRASKKIDSSKQFSANSSAERINAISKNHNNGGGDRENDWKQVREELEKAPAGTVMIQNHSRGLKLQYTKGEDGKWTNSSYSDSSPMDSKTLSMGWVGQDWRPDVEFTTPKNALTSQQLRDSQDAAVSGRLNQALGLDRNNRKIGGRSTKQVDTDKVSNTIKKAGYDEKEVINTFAKRNGWTAEEARKKLENARPDDIKRIMTKEQRRDNAFQPATTSRNARYDTSRANNMSLVSKSSSALKTMYRNASPEEKKIIAAELASRGFYRKNDKWTSMGGGR